MPGAFNPERCPTKVLGKYHKLKLRVKVGMNPDTSPTRTLEFTIDPAINTGDPDESCQFLLQTTRARSKLGSSGAMLQESDCLGCGRRVRCKSIQTPSDQ